MHTYFFIAVKGFFFVSCSSKLLKHKSQGLSSVAGISLLCLCQGFLHLNLSRCCCFICAIFHALKMFLLMSDSEFDHDIATTSLIWMTMYCVNLWNPRSINLFFWFFEKKNEKVLIFIWLADLSTYLFYFFNKPTAVKTNKNAQWET